MAPKPETKKTDITAVDEAFYELQIRDLHRKLAHQRSHNKKMQTRNEEVEGMIRQFEEDRTDVAACLDRKLQEKNGIIKELEDKLSRLTALRSVETTEFRRIIKEDELKYKKMQDELTSETKLLTGRLNSLEEYRDQKEELLTKYHQHETQLRVQTKNHQDIIYDIERKQVLAKYMLRKEVEDRLLQLSTQFTKANEIRVSAHVQRLVRENIALNNELDRMMFTQRRIHTENHLLLEQAAQRRAAFLIMEQDKCSIVQTSDFRLKVISQLTTKYEDLCVKNAMLMSTDCNRDKKDKQQQQVCKDLKEQENKVHVLEQNLHAIRTECQSYQMTVKKQAAELKRLHSIFKELSLTVRSAVHGENQPNDDPNFRFLQRKYLLDDLLKILLTVEAGPATRVSSCETVASVQDLYRLGDIDISWEYCSDRFTNMEKSLQQLDDSVHIGHERVDIEKYSPSIIYESCPIIDVESSSSEFVLSEPPENKDNCDEIGSLQGLIEESLSDESIVEECESNPSTAEPF